MPSPNLTVIVERHRGRDALRALMASGAGKPALAGDRDDQDELCDILKDVEEHMELVPILGDERDAQLRSLGVPLSPAPD